MRMKYSARFLLIISIVAIPFAGICLSGYTGARARQTPQQRPRRVGSEQAEGQKKTPAEDKTNQTQEVGDDDVVRVDTRLVSVPAVVTDQNGHPVTNLTAKNFVLVEDNSAQNITNFTTTEAPFEVALLLDTSGSTRADVALIKGAAKSFIAALRPGDRVSIAAFNTQPDGSSTLATVDVLTRLTSDRKVLESAVEELGSSNGTPYYDSLVRVADDIFKDPPSEQFKGRRALVALTDGVDSSSSSDYSTAKDKLEHAGIACYFIEVNTEDFVEDRLLRNCQGDGTLRLSHTQMERYRHIYAPRTDASDYEDFCKLGQFERMDMSRGLYKLARKEMADLSRSSGGRAFEAAELQDARAAFAQVASEIGTLYSLGYYPSNKAHDGKYRQIHVTLKGVPAQMRVRAREGYFAPRS
jgi:Ca-activated chloride channel family protein